LGQQLLVSVFKFNKHSRNREAPAISVDLGLFWGKKYLDFKNFLIFVNSKDKKFEILLNLNSAGWRLQVAGTDGPGSLT